MNTNQHVSAKQAVVCLVNTFNLEKDLYRTIYSHWGKGKTWLVAYGSQSSFSFRCIKNHAVLM